MAAALTALQKIGREITEKRSALGALFKKDNEGNYTMSKEECDEIQKREDELAPLVAKYDEQFKLYNLEKRNEDERNKLNQPLSETLPYDAGNDGDAERGEIRRGKLKSLGQWARAELEKRIEKRSWDPNASSGFARVEVPFKDDYEYRAVMTTSAGFAPANDRSNVVIYSAQRRPVVQDLIPSNPTGQSLYKYMEETVFTNTAAPVTEAATKPEAALQFTERNAVIEVIAVWLPLTEQQIADVPVVMGIADNRLRLMNAQAEENQVLNGNGTSPQLQGYLTKPGVQTQPKGSDAVPDAILKAITAVQVTGRASASGVVMNPTDWTNIRLLKTADGVYIYGSPAERGPQVIWGLPVVSTDAIAQGTALLGDFTGYSEIVRRQAVTIDVGWINDQFIKNQRSIRCETRLALVIYRGAAFCKVTGLPLAG